MKISLDLLQYHFGLSKMTMMEWAKKSGISYLSIRQIMRGITKEPKASTIAAITGALGITPLDITESAKKEISKKNTPIRPWRIYTKMIELGLSTEYIASQLYMSEDSFISLLNGENVQLSVQQLKHLTRILQLNPAEIIDQTIPLNIQKTSIRGRETNYSMNKKEESQGTPKTAAQK